MPKQYISFVCGLCYLSRISDSTAFSKHLYDQTVAKKWSLSFLYNRYHFIILYSLNVDCVCYKDINVELCKK